MCVQYREGGSYNKYPIDDILVDKYNFDKYRENGIIGNRIVACTFWKYEPDTNCIFMNCPDERLYLPREEHKILKIHVTDDKMFEKCANKLKDKTHLHISVIGANWIPSMMIIVWLSVKLYLWENKYAKGTNTVLHN